METQIIQFTAGRGPAECAWVVAKVLKVFISECNENKITYTIIDRQQGVENGTVQSATVKLKGEQLTNFLATWVGTIQWIGKSTFRKFHKRKNWFIGCYKMEDTSQTIFNEKDVFYQAVRSSAPGGQHVNKVSSAIRAIHKPTNIQVLIMDSRSQHQNKKIARERLLEKLNEFNLNEINNSIKNEWENHLALERGNPIKVFYGSDFKRKKVKEKYKSQRSAEKQKWQNKLE